MLSDAVSTLGSVALVFVSISTLGSDALSFGLTLLFVGDDGLGGGGGTFSFGNVGGIVIFNKVEISINVLVVSYSYVRLGIFGYGDFMRSRRSVVASLRYVSGVFIS